MARPVTTALVLLVLAVGCTPGADAPVAQPTTERPAAVAATGTDADPGAQDFPDVLEAVLERAGDAWRLSATISSPYDSPERYADAFRATTEDGEVLGVRELLHDHAAEQPFTRSLEDLVIPDGVERIVVEGRDLANGWGGRTVTVEVPTG